MRYANLICFELKLSSAYINYFLQILLQFSLSLSFHLSFIYYFNFKRRIKWGKERFDFLFPHGSLVQFILSALWTKINPRKKSCYFTLILFRTSKTLIFSVSYIQQFRFWGQVWVWRTQFQFCWRFRRRCLCRIRYTNYSWQPSAPMLECW